MKRVKEEVNNLLYEVAVKYDALLTRARESDEPVEVMKESQELMDNYTKIMWYIIRRERKRYKRK